jgi:hypothetical protein
MLLSGNRSQSLMPLCGTWDHENGYHTCATPSA